MSKYNKLPLIFLSAEIVLFSIKIYGYINDSFSENTQISITTGIIALSFIYFIFFNKKTRED